MTHLEEMALITESAIQRHCEIAHAHPDAAYAAAVTLIGSVADLSAMSCSVPDGVSDGDFRDSIVEHLLLVVDTMTGRADS